MIHGIDFEAQLITSANMAAYQHAAFEKRSGIVKGCAVTRSGLNLYVAAGYFLAHGRMVQITGTETITAESVQSGTVYCRLVFEVDLSKTNTESDFQQGEFKLLTSTTGYPALTQDDLDEDTTGIYQLPFARFTVTSAGIGSWYVEAFDINEVLTKTLAAGSTSLTFTSPAIKTDSLIDLYVSPISVYPTAATTTAGQCVLTFEPQASAVTVKLKVVG